MFKKIYIPVVLAALVALITGVWVSEKAYALDLSSRRRPQRGAHAIGQVTSISQDQFTLQRPNEDDGSFLVDEHTIFRGFDDSEIEFEDLSTGQWVRVTAVRNEGDGMLARLVVILPEDFDPSEHEGVSGRVSDVDTRVETFTLQTRNSDDVIVTVNEETRYSGGVKNLEDLQNGMLAWAGVKKLDDGNLLALAVRARYPIVKLTGRISEVDISAGTFTLHTRRGDKDVTIIVTNETGFRSREGSIETLADLELDMLAFVSAKKPGGEIDAEQIPPLEALMVAAAAQDQLPKYDWRITGEVVTVDNSTFTIETPKGKQFAFSVTEDTHFRSRNNQVQSLDDLEAGMKVLVGVDDLGSGQYRAGLVIAGHLK